MGRIGKGQLAKIVSERANVSAAAAGRVISQVFEAITEELAKGNHVTMMGFGTWTSRTYTPRVGRNPQDGSEIEIPARTRVLFKTGSKLRSRVEKSVESEIFFGHGINEATKLEGTLARVFGDNPETFHLEETTERIRAVLDEASEQEAAEFFAALCSAAKPDNGSVEEAADETPEDLGEDGDEACEDEVLEHEDREAFETEGVVEDVEENAPEKVDAE